MHEQIDKVALFVHGAIALCGGVARALQQEKRAIIDVAVSAIIAGFTGTIFGMLAMYSVGEYSYLTLSIAGIGGLMGEKGIFFLIEIFKKSIKANIN